MQARKLGLVAAVLLIAACSRSNPPSTTPAASNTQPPAAEADAGAAADAPQTAAAELVSDESAGAPIAGKFRIGVHYQRLSPTQPTSSPPDQVEVAEVFWYGCPHCYHFDPQVEAWRAKKPEYVNFIRIPAVWNPLLQLHARAFYTAEALGKGAEMHSEFFREIHERGNALDTEAKLTEFFGRFGVDAAAFKSAFDSFAVHAKLQRADELNRRYRISGVPTLIINGKYTTEGSQTASYDELLELATELAAAEHAAK
ncbi:MAG TPA: thiol:disulfide interchange protein DsbA/DsbL [Gammaproteobacteria bacterium]|jgi:thiol:disulfide interchange protein DsbA|nr:thiol:disulfide interchange protein DsbA/DsbL [Gammaproteobacteria bacterium]